jgi:DNA-binding transcriptional LysR family regulator
MELRHIRYFIAVAEEGRIAWAAERLGMQQPPLSQQIKALERELDVQLFHRKARGVELTEAGRAFLDNARVMLAQLDHACETTRRTARGEQGRIGVGIVPTSPFHPFVPRVIRAFREAYPLVSLTLEECPSNELAEHLRAVGYADDARDRHGVTDEIEIELVVERLVVCVCIGDQEKRRLYCLLSPADSR